MKMVIGMKAQMSWNNTTWVGNLGIVQHYRYNFKSCNQNHVHTIADIIYQGVTNSWLLITGLDWAGLD